MMDLCMATIIFGVQARCETVYQEDRFRGMYVSNKIWEKGERKRES